MKRKKVIYPSTEVELEKLSTKQLLARLNYLHQCEVSKKLSDKDFEDIPNGSILFKESLEWNEEYKRLKRILANREHIIKGKALPDIRKRKAKKARSLNKNMDKAKQC
jgi:hypothetical protein